jgi:hydroxymethylpyrimidine/phosphomethylpyrimidine kinase
MPTRSKPLICSIGSTDPTAAAGIGRDLIVYERLGAAGVFAVAAITAQNAHGVYGVDAVTPRILAAQLKAVWQEHAPAAIRIGLLPDAKLIAVVARFVRSLRKRPPIVLDPVMRASSGARFLGAAELRALERLLPLVSLVTPNVAEAEALTGLRIRDLAGAERAAVRLHEHGCAVLLKGGHLPGARVTDILVDDTGLRRFSAPRIEACMRGTGCTLAAAIAVFLAQGLTLARAVARARSLVRRELEAQRRARPKGRA